MRAIVNFLKKSWVELGLFVLVGVAAVLFMTALPFKDRVYSNEDWVVLTEDVGNKYPAILKQEEWQTGDTAIMGVYELQELANKLPKATKIKIEIISTDYVPLVVETKYNLESLKKDSDEDKH